MKHPVGETGRARPCEDRRQRRQQQRSTEGDVDNGSDSCDPGQTAERGWNRRADRQPEQGAGDTTAEDPEFLGWPSQPSQYRAAVERQADQLVRDMSMDLNAVIRINRAEPGIEWGRKRIPHTVQGAADNDRPVA